MRRPTTFAAALAVAGTLVCSLAGCAAGGTASAGAPTPASDSPSASAVDLLGVWTVEGAGSDSGSTLWVQGRSISLTVSSTAATSSFAWAGEADQVLITRSTLAMAGGSSATWLTAATRVEQHGDGWTLLDASGHATARLEPAAHSSPQGSPTPQPTDLPADATPGPGVTEAPASALEGRWHLDGHPTTAITFTDGRWRAAASCETGASGGSGAYRVLADGRLLITRTASLMFGCPIGQDDERVRAPAIAGIDRAGSFRVEESTLTLYDRTGAAIGSLVR